MSTKDPNYKKVKTQLEFMKLSGVAFLWAGLAALVYIPTSTDSTTVTIVAILGFLSFSTGVIMLFNSMKGEIIEYFQDK